ncbi:NfeD family protein [Scatolibacter rhodanostii]|uniref:NfeD family protein n=1 Tax=Scatolibacter rhodanostii TaxID=2014781 RepID=UPI000C087CAB|nr:NfeD family protein [Scatolibacter rhodanostii]
MDNAVYLWLGLIVLSVIAESASSQLISIWFVFGGLGGLIASLLHVPVTGQVVIATIISLLCIFFTRPIVKKKLEVKRVRTNADRFIGEKAMVTREIDNVTGIGQVSVKGITWTARSEDEQGISEGTEVEVLAIEGVKLIVRQIQI